MDTDPDFRGRAYVCVARYIFCVKIIKAVKAVFRCDSFFVFM